MKGAPADKVGVPFFIQILLHKQERCAYRHCNVCLCLKEGKTPQFRHNSRGFDSFIVAIMPRVVIC